MQWPKSLSGNWRKGIGGRRPFPLSRLGHHLTARRVIGWKKKTLPHSAKPHRRLASVSGRIIRVPQAAVKGRVSLNVAASPAFAESCPRQGQRSIEGGSLPNTVNRPLVILFMEEHKAATVLNSLLTANGVSVTWVCSDEEFLEAIEHSGHDVVITRTHHIGTVCRFTRLQIINVEKFVFKTIEQDEGAGPRWSFDHQAFIQCLNSIVRASSESH